jgi:hypothetical protein
MAMTEPPALLKALADRAATGKVDDLKIYYCESTSIAGKTILRYELTDRVHPYCMFVAAVERALIKKGEEDGGRKVLTYFPGNFHEFPRFLTEHIGIDTFLVTVSPMDRHGYFTFGTGNDCSSKVARAAKHLIVEVNDQMPRVYGSLAQLHVSEVEAIVENNVPLPELPVRASGPEDAVIGKTIAEMQTPATRWVPSSRRYDPDPPPSRYPEDAEVKQLGSQGQLQLDGQRWEITKALARERVRLIRLHGRILVYYCNSLLKEIDLLAQHISTVERWTQTQPNCKGCPDNAV